MTTSKLRLLAVLATVCAAWTSPRVWADDNGQGNGNGQGANARGGKGAAKGSYVETDLVSDQGGMATVTDPNLVNAWGLVASATGPWWVNDNGTGLSTLYNGEGAVQALVVTVPGAPGSSGASAPTGIALNTSSTDFLMGANAPAHFLFVTEDGTISGWNTGKNAVLEVDNSAANASYKGVALGQINGGAALYAANFTQGSIDVYDTRFKAVALPAHAFTDPAIPKEFHPFNVQAIDGKLYVTFAHSQAGSIDELHGPGQGFVDVFTMDGRLDHRLKWGTYFNAPWGIAAAPANFGTFSNDVLVGEFGSGKIAAFDATSGDFKGVLRGADHKAIRIDGLWGIQFGNGGSAGPATSLYFAAGPDDEAHGLLGTLTFAPESGASGQGKGDQHGHGNNPNGSPDGG